MSSPQQEKGERHYLPSLTGLRFFAAASIFLGHMTGAFSFQISGYVFHWNLLNCLGMPLFFVLSGFIVHYNYAESFHTKPFGHSAKDFLLARFSRIYPLFFFVFVFYLVQDNLLMGWIEEGRALHICLSVLAGVFTWYPLYTHDQLVYQYGSFGVAWSIATEFFFYWAYIFMARPIYQLNTTRKAAGFFVLCVIAGYAVQIAGPWNSTENFLAHILGTDHPKGTNALFLHSYYRWAFYHSPYSRIFEFLLGCATAQLFLISGAGMRFPRLQSIGLWSILFSIFVLLVAVNLAYQEAGWASQTAALLPRYIMHLALNFLFAPLMAGLILIFALRDAYFPQINRMMAHPKLVFLGEISLSLYLMHPFIITAFPIHPDMTFIPLRLLVSVSLIIAIAIGTYTLIEVPSRRFLRGLFHVGKRSHSPVVVKTSA